MCLAIPAKVLTIEGSRATVDFGGINKEVDISLVEVEVGTYVIIHAGYAIQVLDEEEANRSLEIFKEILEE